MCYNIVSVLFWLFDYKACGILAPQPGIKPLPPALEARSLNHWTTREVPGNVNLMSLLIQTQWLQVDQSGHCPTHTILILVSFTQFTSTVKIPPSFPTNPNPKILQNLTFALPQF